MEDQPNDAKSDPKLEFRPDIREDDEPARPVRVSADQAIQMQFSTPRRFAGQPQFGTRVVTFNHGEPEADE